jgi:hypothetical protein
VRQVSEASQRSLCSYVPDVQQAEGAAVRDLYESVLEICPAGSAVNMLLAGRSKMQVAGGSRRCVCGVVPKQLLDYNNAMHMFV